MARLTKFEKKLFAKIRKFAQYPDMNSQGDNMYGFTPYDNDPNHWDGMWRYNAQSYLEENYQYIFFLDTQKIINATI